MLPEMPSWAGMHPFAAHFPIALLMVAPIFCVAALFSNKHSSAYYASSFVLMILGTVSAYVSSSTGQAAWETARYTPRVLPVLQHHEDLAGITVAIFGTLTCVYGLMLFFQRRMRGKLPRIQIICAHIVFLIAFAGGCLVLLHTGHEGGRLVYEFNVRVELNAHAPAQP